MSAIGATADIPVSFVDVGLRPETDMWFLWVFRSAAWLPTRRGRTGGGLCHVNGEHHPQAGEIGSTRNRKPSLGFSVMRWIGS